MIESVPVHYFIKGNFLGTGFQRIEFRGKHIHRNLTFWSPNSFVIICPTCGEAWARGLSEHPEATHHARQGKCPAHGGGSIIQTAARDELQFLPRTRAFLLYELELWNRDPAVYFKKDLISQTA